MNKLLLVLACVVIVVVVLVGRYLLPQTRAVRNASVVRSLSDVESRLNALDAASDDLRLSSIGEVRYGGEDMSLWMVSRKPKGETKRRVLLTACIHGNEASGGDFLMQFAESLVEHAERYPGIAFDIVPILNPWGWSHDTRRNGDGYDLNRDFASFNAQESVLLRDLVAANAYDLHVDLHEDGSADGFYIYRLANPDAARCRDIVDALKEAGHPVENGRVMTIFRANDGVINCPRWSLVIARKTRQLSFSNYTRLEGCPQAFLFEAPQGSLADTRVAMEQVALDALIDQLFDESDG